ncbi:MAG: response regulator transcription factor [Myxococcales bacterium]|nr:response regulator transcription factor [Myxococcales bacterium]
MIRVFLADDHPIVRTGLKALLSLADDIEVVGEAIDGRKVLLAADSPDWAVDVLVLDISLPQVNGIEVLRRLQETRPEMPVLMLSMYAEDQYARRLVDLGAAGYVSKDRSEDELIAAIRVVAGGGLYISRRAARGASAVGEPARDLTPRQHQIFTLLVEGLAVTDIAAQLNLSVSTVSTHVGQIKRALGARTVQEIVSYAHRMDLIE